MLLLIPLVRAATEVEQSLIVGKAVDFLATHFKVRPVSATPLVLGAACFSSPLV